MTNNQRVKRPHSISVVAMMSSGMIVTTMAWYCCRSLFFFKSVTQNWNWNSIPNYLFDKNDVIAMKLNLKKLYIVCMCSVCVLFVCSVCMCNECSVVPNFITIWNFSYLLLIWNSTVELWGIEIVIQFQIHIFGGTK